jgi:uncharacterized protein YndB with AHSA1/START domain
VREIRIERVYRASPEQIWELWTTPGGIEQWWAPDGFDASVQELDLRDGGELRHSLTATTPETVQFMESAGLPLTTHATKRFTEIDEPRRLGYVSVVDFVPGVEPYDHLTEVELHPEGGGTRVVMTVHPMHDEEWTQRLVAGREDELANLERLLSAE